MQVPSSLIGLVGRAVAVVAAWSPRSREVDVDRCRCRRPASRPGRGAGSRRRRRSPWTDSAVASARSTSSGIAFAGVAVGDGGRVGGRGDVVDADRGRRALHTGVGLGGRCSRRCRRHRVPSGRASSRVGAAAGPRRRGRRHAVISSLSAIVTSGREAAWRRAAAGDFSAKRACGGGERVEAPRRPTRTRSPAATGRSARVARPTRRTARGGRR